MEVKYREEQVITSPYGSVASASGRQVSENGAEKAVFYTRRNDRNV